MNVIKYFKEQAYGDKLSRKFVKERFKGCHNLYRKNILGHFGCVNAMAFSSDGNLFTSGGDDQRVLLWKTSDLIDVKVPKAVVMNSQHMTNVFATIFDCDNKFIFSAGMDEDVLRHDIVTKDLMGVFRFEESVYSVHTPFDNAHFFVAACGDGSAQVVDIRSSEDRVKVASSIESYHSAVFHPLETQYIATANSEDGIALWDIRRPKKPVKDFYRKHENNYAMSVRFDYTGRRILSLVRKGGPVLYDIGTGEVMFRFKEEHYRNVCTMKSACFGGDKDEYVICGSDDFNVYIWKIPDDNFEGKDVNTPHIVLEGHRSIVNQVRYDRHHDLLSSAGVEKCIKVWSCFPMNGCHGDITNDEHFVQRQKYTHEQYATLTMETGDLSHDYDAGLTDEDPRMMAMFDTLIEKTKNDWASDTDEEDGDSETSYNRAILNILFEREISSSENEQSDANDNENNTALGNNDESARAFGVSLDELRRIFRANRKAAQQPHSNEEGGNNSLTTNSLDNSTTTTNSLNNSTTTTNSLDNSRTATNSFDNSKTTTNNLYNSRITTNSLDNSRTTTNGLENSRTTTNSLGSQISEMGNDSTPSNSTCTNVLTPFHRRLLLNDTSRTSNTSVTENHQNSSMQMTSTNSNIIQNDNIQIHSHSQTKRNEVLNEACVSQMEQCTPLSPEKSTLNSGGEEKPTEQNTRTESLFKNSKTSRNRNYRK